ncbi:hypothetical protein M0R88_01370 [Halorussus gelatinilyticus]|uniref:Uncharacterized protein n=1 Tax=Halorussus gelatinilyticus TaxID=2937524 RepID=A0A8U0II46_9EURY|nr:hypothetical protein [Halorussus gelatinilyticus]UPW00767.1 hypothetical protein M0R88_01370 [Halorussus gelatinilyticus]
MTHCYNCGHSGTFVLLAQLAFAVPGPADGSDCASDTETQRLPASGDCSLAVQCPACDSTDVGVAAGDLLARYGSSTTS